MQRSILRSVLRPLSPLLLGAGLALASPLLLQPDAQESDGAQEHEHSELEEQMEVVEHAVKKLRRSLRDVANLDESLALVVEMQRAAFDCKMLVPRMAAQVAEAERPAFEAAYRRMMVDLLVAQLELEAALLDGDADATQAAFARVREMEDTGHERFTGFSTGQYQTIFNRHTL